MAPVAVAAPCCGAAAPVAYEPTPVADSYSHGSVVNEAGEEIVPGSVQVTEGDSHDAPVEAAIESAVDVVPDGI